MGADRFSQSLRIGAEGAGMGSHMVSDAYRRRTNALLRQALKAKDLGTQAALLALALELNQLAMESGQDPGAQGTKSLGDRLPYSATVDSTLSMLTVLMTSVFG
jgi:hypothetical protein